MEVLNKLFRGLSAEKSPESKMDAERTGRAQGDDGDEVLAERGLCPLPVLGPIVIGTTPREYNTDDLDPVRLTEEIEEWFASSNFVTRSKY